MNQFAKRYTTPEAIAEVLCKLSMLPAEQMPIVAAIGDSSIKTPDLKLVPSDSHFVGAVWEVAFIDGDGQKYKLAFPFDGGSEKRKSSEPLRIQQLWVYH